MVSTRVAAARTVKRGNAMARKVKAYTDIGRRIADLGKRQRQIAKVLRVSQQTVSKKLRGETAMLLSDLETTVPL